MGPILIFFMKALTALTYILAMLFPFILIGWCFAEWRKSKARRERWNETSKSRHEEFGKESCHTYHHQFKEDMPFFLDYTFTNIPLFAYMIGGWERKVSDHNAQIIVI